MKTFLLFNFTFIFLMLPACVKNQKYQDVIISREYKLVWSDEFNYTGLPDPDKWGYDTEGNSWGWGNQELQNYTEARKENVWVSDGVLRITARKEKWEDKSYTSVRLRSKDKGDWLYGKIEVRAKLPAGIGLWPAIWMLPTDWEYGNWPSSGEIDIMENVGYIPDTIYASIHTKAYHHSIGTQKTSGIYMPDNRDQFYSYILELDENNITISVDGNRFFSFVKEEGGHEVWPFDKRFHLLLNIAVGGSWGGQKGVDDTIFPATMEIDYVRVYQ